MKRNGQKAAEMAERWDMQPQAAQPVPKGRAMDKLRRLLWFLLRNLLIILVVVAAIIGLLFSARAASNIGIIVKEGMRIRADVVLYDADFDMLEAYFTEDFVHNDPLLNAGRYDDYVISNHSYKILVAGFWCWPWQQHITVRATEVVSNINGDLRSESLSKDPDESRVPPAWESAELAISLCVVDGKWKIDSLQPIQLVQPVMSATPMLDAGTPTPDASATAAASAMATH